MQRNRMKMTCSKFRFLSLKTPKKGLKLYPTIVCLDHIIKPLLIINRDYKRASQLGTAFFKLCWFERER